MKTLYVVAAIVVVGSVSGCGSVLGVRNFEVWNGGPRWEFAEGQDFHIGANSIDTVQNQRSVSSRSRGTQTASRGD